MPRSDRQYPDDQLQLLAFENAPVGLLAVDAERRITAANAAAESLFGYQRGELCGQLFSVLFPDLSPGLEPDASREEIDRYANRVRRETAGFSKDQSQVFVEIDVSRSESDDGLVTLYSVANFDAHKSAGEVLESAVEACPCGMVVVDERGSILVANTETERLFGYDPGELAKVSVDQLVPEASRGAHAGFREAYLKNPVFRPMGHGRRLLGVRKDGVEIPVEIGLSPIRRDGRVFVLASIIDLRPREESERELSASENRFRALVEGIPDYGILMLDRVGRILSWNSGAQRITGFSADEMHDASFSRLLASRARIGRMAEVAISLAIKDGRFEGEVPLARSDGAEFAARLSLTLIEAGDGPQGPGFVLILHDLSAEREREERLRQSQKLEAIGSLTSGIAHDFNNILTGIVGFTELASGVCQDRPEVCEDLGRVLAAADRGRLLIKRLLAFSRSREPSFRRINIVSVVGEALQLLRASIPSTVEIVEKIDLATPEISGDETMIHQVVMNLGANSAQAMEEGNGVFTIELNPIEMNEELARRRNVMPGSYVRIRASDNGSGMDKEALERAFEPFFTTKPSGKGTGLGLAVVHGIITAHQGAISIKSVPRVGTTVDILIPCARETTQEEPLRVSEDPSHETVPRVMVVEDEAHLAELLRRQLESAGYKVSTFTSSLAALRAFENAPESIDLVVSDNTMPQLSGTELAQRIVTLRPGIPFLMVSGIGDALDAQELEEMGVQRLLPKPHSMSELLTEVRELLATAP